MDSFEEDRKVVNRSKMAGRTVAILVMGACGAGKSTFINAAVGANKMTVHHDSSVKVDPLHVHFSVPDQLGLYSTDTLWLVEIPGFDGTETRDLSLLKELGNLIMKIHDEKSVIGGIIYLHDISQKRFDSTTQRNFDILNRLCGENTLGRIVLATTNWPEDWEPTDPIVIREKDLIDRHWAVLINKGSCASRFIGTRESAAQLVRMALQGLEHGGTLLDIQKELVSEQKDILETKAGKYLKEFRALKAKSKRILSPTAKRTIEILIMGACGAGKSTFINTLVGSDKLKVHHSSSINKDPFPVPFSAPDQLGLKYDDSLWMVEIPGFDNTDPRDVSVLKEVGDWIMTTHNENSVIGGIIYLHDISQKRIDGTAQRNFEIFRKLCGESALQEIVLATTNWPAPDDAKSDAETSDIALREKDLIDEHWSGIIKKGARTIRFDGTRDSAQKVVEMALQRLAIRSIELEIHRELASGKCIQDTEAGRYLKASNVLNAKSDINILTLRGCGGRDNW